MAESQGQETAGVCGEAVDFLRLVADADSFNRAEALDDLKFGAGDQWPVDIQNSRQLEARPCLTINETDSFIRQICNQQRQQRPRGKAHPVNSTSDPKIAEVITGIGRHIENNSDADNAYDIGFEFAVRMGWGYWRIITDYVLESSFDQDIYVKPVDNPFTVYFDPNSTLPDGSDADRCLITDLMTKEAFRQQYPGANDGQFSQRATGDIDPQWVTLEDIRLAEYFKVERAKHKLIRLSDGTTLWDDEMPPAALLAQAQVTVIGDRDSYKREVWWSKVTAFEELERKKLDGRWIPVVPVYGFQLTIEGKRRKWGLIHNAKDPQRMINFWQTSITESIALAPKAKWLIAEGQDEGFENDFAQANVKSAAVLRYKPTTVSGREVAPPSRIAPEMPPAGAIQAAMDSTRNLQRVVGIFDPATKPNGNQSGKALEAERMQSEMSNYHFYDNLTRSIKHTWRIFLDLTPKVYDTPGRVMRVIGEDGKPDLVTLNEKKEGDAANKILNDVTVGTYDVVMETGPGFNTKRQEGVAAFTELMKGPLGEIVAQAGSDIAVRMIDAPQMDILADRLAAANPLAQIDEKLDIPPQVQMKLKQQEQQIQQMGQALQQAGIEIKFGLKKEEMKQAGETKRALMKETNDAHEREITQKQKQHDTEVYALSAQNVAEINGLVKLLTTHLANAQAVKTFEHQAGMQDKELEAKSRETETVQ